jgi:Cap4 dsDNA endonuclease
MTDPKRLSSIASADRVGSLTGRQYDYQHEQAAFSALEMLARSDWQCVYCEWHEDFVVERGDEPAPYYLFHQVKSKSLSQGPWTLRELFGVSALKSSGAPNVQKSTPVKVADDAIFLRLLNHEKAFGVRCGSFVFVTNTSVQPTVSKLFDAITLADTHSALEGDARALFHHLARGYCRGTPALLASEEELFALLRRFAIETERGSLKQEAALNEICDRVFEYGEIDLQVNERKQIARQLVQLIRSKATDHAVRLPIDDNTFRARKGVVIAEVLNVLSLSHDGYQALLAGGVGKDLVKTLSRLERFCRTHGLHEYMPQICSFKAKWNAWRTQYRHQIQDSDYVAVVATAREIAATNKPLSEMVTMAKSAAAALNVALPSGISIAADEVLGIVFSLAAGAETT